MPHGATVTVSYSKPSSNPLQDAAGNDVASFSAKAVTNNTPDTTAPAFSSAAVNGTALTVTFNQNLDTGSLPAGSAFTVSGGRNGTGTVSVSGSTASVTLDSAVPHGETVTVSYSKPSSNPLQDAAGNDVASFSAKAVTNNTPDTTAPTFSSATVNGTALTVTFNEDLDTGSLPAGSSFTVSGGRNGTGTVTVSDATASVTLDSAVPHGETVTVSYSKPSSNPLQDAAGNDVASFSSQAVPNNTPDTTAPVFSSAAVNGTALTVTFNQNLDSGSLPAGSSFTVSGGRTGTGTVSVSGSTASVTLDSAVSHGETVTVSYSKPSTNPLQDSAGNDVASFSAKAVANNTPDTTGPAFSSAAVNGTALTVTFSESLDTGSRPAGSAFTVSGGRTGTGTVSVSGSTARVTLDSAVEGGETVTVSYAKPAANPLQNAAGNDVASFSGRPVTNNTPDAGGSLTARFASIRTTHNGSAFTFRIQFSATVAVTSGTDFRDHSVEALGGTVTDADRLAGNLWEITVEPVGRGAVVLAVSPPASCAEPGALCTFSGRLLSARVEALVLGPDTGIVTIAPVASAITEGEPAAFRLRRSGGTGPALTVGLSVTGAGDFIVGSRPQSAAFPAGDATASLDIPTEDDAVADPGALLTVELAEDTASPPDYVLGSARRAVLQVRDNDGGAPPPPLPGSGADSRVRRNPVPLQLALWTDRPGYLAGETVRLYRTVDPHDDRGRYRTFVYLEKAGDGEPRYLAPLSASGELHLDPVDARGMPAYLARARNLTAADRELSWEGAAPGPGVWQFVLELRPGESHEQGEEFEEPLRTRRAWAKFTVAERSQLLNRRGFDREIRTDMTLSSDTIHYLGHQLFVHAGATLTIEPGTLVRAWGRHAAIIVEPGGKIVAEGTREAPVVLTCSDPVGRRRPGCWGGLRILGKAPVTRLEGTAPGVLPAARPVYGGTDEEHSSGVLRYVRVEFAGAAAEPEASAAAIGLYGAGSGTVLDHVQARSSGGDGIAFAGGTAACSHCVASGSSGAGLSWERGWRGGASHVYVQHGRGGRDGLSGAHDAEGHDREPRSQPTMSNVTLVHAAPYGRHERRAVGVQLSSGSAIRACCGSGGWAPSCPARPGGRGIIPSVQ